MTSEVYYRKWRPQTLAEITGQEHVTQTLLRALETGRIAHAYLFCGPRGTGKTSTGRILAKAVNCITNGKGEPCNSCDMCFALTQGRALDIIEIDAASNRGIDDIRELREKVKFSPNSAKYKVYIIDEVHALTEHASNALLKTLEEPPAHAIFILATTEPHKLLTTILSRCQRFDFRRLTHDAVMAKLSFVCQKERIIVPPEGLRLIAKSVSGSLRDAENLLQQLVIYYGNEVQLNQVEDMLGITNDSRIRQLVQHIAGKDLAAGLSSINDMSHDGLDLMQVNRGLVDYLRNMLLAKSGAEASLDLSADDRAQVKELAGKMSLEEIVRAVKLFGQIDFRSRDYSSLPLELAFVECLVPEEPGGTAAPTPKAKAQPARPASTPKPRPAQKPKEQDPPSALHPQAEGTAESRLDYVKAHWEEFVDTLRGAGSSGNLDAYLRSACEPEALDEDGTLVVAFKYLFHKEKVEDTKYRRMIEQRLATMFGSPNKLRCVLRVQNARSAMDGHLVKAALQMGGRITEVVTDESTTGGSDE